MKDDSILSVTVDGKTANINLETRVGSSPCVSRHLGNRVKVGIRPQPEQLGAAAWWFGVAQMVGCLLSGTKPWVLGNT